jgi:Flp pilus assembly protein TadG
MGNGRSTERLRAFRNSTTERGTAVVEFALLLTAFSMLVFGSISGAIAYNHKSDVIHAVREGARYGATIPETQCNGGACSGGQTWAQLVQSITANRSSGALTTSQVCVALVTGSTQTVVGGASQSSFSTKTDGSGNPTKCFDDGGADTGTRVQVTASRSGDTIQAIMFSLPVTQSAQAIAHYEQ